jgi:hypothetical protein
MKRLLVSALALSASVLSPLMSTVREVPPPLSELAGAYVGSVSGATLQRLVLNPDGSGHFVDVWFDSGGHRALSYAVAVRDYKNWRIRMQLTPLKSGDRPLRVEGEASFFEMSLQLSATEKYRKRSVRLYRETTFMSMLETARQFPLGTADQ